ncbi:glycosyltransferase [Candidatus Woesearchaeota archaeon]|nr:glycosyltransferase [Candidatus Woesearchaeota archaeon]
MDAGLLISSVVEHKDIGSLVTAYYTQVGRPILDFLHLIFDNVFDITLFLAIILSVLYFYFSINSFFLKDKKRNWRFDEKKAPFVTVQIPTYNELVAIRCAKRCLDFNYPKNRYEIIIGDDSKDKRISKKLDEFAKKHSLVKITRRGNNKGYKAGNLNHMLKFSKGDILVLFDSDFTPSDGFLRKIVAPFMHDNNIAGVQARWKSVNTNQNPVTLLGSTIISVFHFITLPFVYKKRRLSFLCGSAEAVRKDTLVKLGGWEDGSLTEDIECSLRLLNNGYKIEYLDDLECGGEVPHKPRDLYKQQMRWAYGVIKSFKDHSKTIIRNKNLDVQDRLLIHIMLSGYLLSVLFILLFLTGFLTLITHRPEPIDFAKFFTDLGRNVLLTSGILVASMVALTKTSNLKRLPSMVYSSFRYGLIVTFYVNVGIFKVLIKKPMQWYMLNKLGNETIQ